MTYKVIGKTPNRSNGQITSTTIDIRQDEPYTIISRTFNEDLTNAEDSRAIELVLELVNEETTPKSELKSNIKDLKEELDRTKKVVTEQKELIEQQVQSNQLLSNAFDGLTFLVLEKVIPELEKEEPEEAENPEPEEADPETGEQPAEEAPVQGEEPMEEVETGAESPTETPENTVEPEHPSEDGPQPEGVE